MAEKKKSSLKISVFSFGFQKSGIPDNEYDDGGGFVFDCRFLPNPFDDPDLREYTGKDKKIKDFFGGFRAVDSFVHECVNMVEKAANTYLLKKYTNLQISFGCTGGRHRSVYCAENFKKVMKKKGWSLELEHIEL